MAKISGRADSPDTQPSPIRVSRARAHTIARTEWNEAPEQLTLEVPPRRVEPASSDARSDISPVKALVPEKDHRLYDAERINLAFEWTRARLNEKIDGERRITPRTELAIIIHQNRCLIALKEGITEESQKMIQEFETDINHEGWLKAVLPADIHSMTQELIKLRWHQILASVGDFMKMEVGDIREKARQLQTDEHYQLSGKFQWTEISAKLKREEIIEQQYGDRDQTKTLCDQTKTFRDQTKTFRALQNVCYFGQLDFKHATMCIHTYAERNSAFHNDIAENIKASLLNNVARTLHRTLNELWSLVPADRLEDGQLLRGYFEELRDRWFDSSFDLSNPDTWDVKEELKQLRDSMQPSERTSSPLTPKKLHANQSTKSPSARSPASQASSSHVPTASIKYLQTPIAPLNEYRLPTSLQMPPAHNDQTPKRDLSENAPPSGRDKRIKTQLDAWKSVIDQDRVVHSQFQEHEISNEVLEEVQKQVAATRPASQEA